MIEVTPNFKTPRIRDADYLDHIRGMRCVVPGCYAGPIHPHHLKCGPEGGGSVKASDCWAIPMCFAQHRQLHDHPYGERAWWRMVGIDPIAWCRREWEAWAAMKSAAKALPTPGAHLELRQSSGKPRSASRRLRGGEKYRPVPPPT